MTLKAAQQLQELHDEDLRILMAVEIGMKKFNFVPVNHVKFFARYNDEETQYYLDHSHKVGVLIRSNEKQSAYKLNSEGYDVLALHALFEKKIITSIGPPLGRGKESDVYRGLTPDNNEVAIKFHRLGQTSFRKIKQLRSYIENRKHISWLYVNRLSATREFTALERIYDLGLNTPKPIVKNRHAIVMSIIQGDEISKFPFLNQPEELFNEIIDQYKIFFEKAHIIHGDLGEFNILLNPNDEILIIDWPQWEDWNHPNAIELIRRDIENICSFFSKKHGIKSDSELIIEDIIKLNPDLYEKYLNNY